MIHSIPKFDGADYVECSRSFNDILQIYWHFLSKIVTGLDNPEPILRHREEGPIRLVIMTRVILMNVNPPMLMALGLGIWQMNTCLVF